MKPGVLHVVLLLIVALASCRQDSALRRDADALLAGLHAAGDFSGAVMFGQDGRVVYQGAFGMADRTRPFRLDTAADGASVAKTVTAAVIWQLVDDGLIGLDDPVQDHLVEFPYADVTIRHLLSHTAALPDYDAFQPVLDAGQPVGNADLLVHMGRASPGPLRAPGATFSYCNICYDTLALLAERVTGASYAEHAVTDLLGGLGARDAFLRPVGLSDWPQPRTLGFHASLPDAEIFDVFDNEAFYGGSNIYFTVRDLHAWASAWASGRVLSAPTLDLALAPARIGTSASAISLSSWYCAPARDRCYYTGHHQGFFNLIYWDASRRLTVVFVSNSTLSPPLQPWLMQSLVGLAEGRAAGPAPAVPPDGPTVDLAAVAGRYRVPGIGEVQISQGPGGPVMKTGRSPDYQLYQVGYGVLYAPGMDAYVSFEAAEDGNPATMIWRSLFTNAEGVQQRD